MNYFPGVGCVKLVIHTCRVFLSHLMPKPIHHTRYVYSDYKFHQSHPTLNPSYLIKLTPVVPLHISMISFPEPNYIINSSHPYHTQVSVQLYSDYQFHQPLSGELVSVTTYTPGKVVGFSTAVTDVNGRACVSMPCNNEHELTVSTSSGDIVIVSENHYLAEGYSAFQNKDSSVIFHSDKLEDYKDLDGPVYPFSTGACVSLKMNVMIKVVKLCLRQILIN